MSLLNIHPGMPEFDYVKPASLEEASKFLHEHAGEARPLLGGTDIFVRTRDGAWHDKYLVDVKGLPGMKDIHFDPAKGLYLGAGVNMNRVAAHPEVQAHYPMLAEACNTVASYQLRNRATIVGNICNASPAGDTIGMCILLGGVLKVHGLDGWRDEPLTTFFRGPGKTVLNPGDVATAITFPLPPAGAAGRYIKLGRNKASDLAIVGISALGYPEQAAPSGFCIKLALASVAPIPLVVTAVEKLLAEKPINAEVLAEAAQAAMDACRPIDDVRGSARYRQHMVRNLSLRALSDVWNELKKEQVHA